MQESLLQKWQECLAHRYSFLLILPPNEHSLSRHDLEVFAKNSNSCLHDFIESKPTQIGKFVTWKSVQEEIVTLSRNKNMIFTGVEPFTAKWPSEEELVFYKKLLRTEWTHPVVLVSYTKLDLSELTAITPNNRGRMWIPKK